MASYYGDVDLMKLPGAYVASDGRGNNVVVVPVEHSEIKVTEDMRHAYMHIVLDETNEKYRQACIDRNEQRGADKKQNYVAPSNTVKLSYSKDKREALIKALAQKIVEKEHPDWITYDPTMRLMPDGTENPLYKAIRDRINITIGNITPFGGSQATFTGTAPVGAFTPLAPMTQQGAAATDGKTQQYAQMLGGQAGAVQDEGDDLPF